MYNSKLVKALELVTSNLESREERPGQVGMALAIDSSIENNEHLVVEAGTGTGKTIAYLLPFALAEKSVVVATYTKALQDQMLNSDLPRIKKYIESEEKRSFKFVQLKGWSNYLCNERLDAVEKSKSTGLQQTFFAENDLNELDQIIEWSKSTTTGDRSDVTFSIKESTWNAVSVSSKECFGKEKCLFYESCFAFKSRKDSTDADVLVTNHALYAIDLSIGGHLIGPHDHVVIDEAHEMEASFTMAWSIRLNAGRFEWLASHAKRIINKNGFDVIKNINEVAALMTKNMIEHGEQWVYSGNAAAILETLELAEGRIEILNHLVKSSSSDERTKLRITKAGDSLLEDVRAIRRFLADTPTLSQVAWIELNKSSKPELNIAPLNTAENLGEYLWSAKQTVLTSATIQTNLIERLGVPTEDEEVLKIESPFNYEKQGLLYCPNIPDPTKENSNWQKAVLVEIENLITLAGGRTLCLVSSRSELHRITEEMRKRLDVPILMQGEKSPKELLRNFTENEKSCLFGTRTFFQGVDVPGSSLSMVILNRIPFPGPSEFLIKAWSQQSDVTTGNFGWREIELPVGVLRVVQAAGRLIRKKDDYGVVAILDPRMTRADYAKQFLSGLPNMPITEQIDDVEVFFASNVMNGII